MVIVARFIVFPRHIAEHPEQVLQPADLLRQKIVAAGVGDQVVQPAVHRTCLRDETRRRPHPHREREWLGGFDGDLCPQRRTAALLRDPFQDELHEVVVADRHRAARQQHVARVGRVLDRGGDRPLVVAHDATVDRLAAELLAQREEHRPVGVADTARLQRAALDQLVARRDHTDARARVTRHLVDVEARENAQVRGRQQHAAREDELAGLHITTGEPHVLARLRHLDDDVVAVDARPLDHHDGVGAFGHRRARHDANRLARSDRDRRGASGRQLTDHPQ